MKQRGRKSAAETAVVVQGNFGRRPEPPEDLTEPQQRIWRDTVAGEALDCFSTAALKNMLADYCRHRATIEMVAAIIDSFQPEWLKSAEGAKRFDGLLKMREAETRNAASLATKMRLTNQSRYTPQAAATAARNAGRGFRPWET